jgi:hypothetical protein
MQMRLRFALVIVARLFDEPIPLKALQWDTPLTLLMDHLEAPLDKPKLFLASIEVCGHKAAAAGYAMGSYGSTFVDRAEL